MRVRCAGAEKKAGRKTEVIPEEEPGYGSPWRQAMGPGGGLAGCGSACVVPWSCRLGLLKTRAGPPDGTNLGAAEGPCEAERVARASGFLSE